MAASVKTFQNNNPPSCEDDDLNGFILENNNLIESAGITLDDTDHDQTTQAVAHYAGSGNFYTDSGAANAYTLAVVGSHLAPPSYSDGMLVRFLPTNASTGASTINVAGLGVKDIKNFGGTVIQSGQISTSQDCELRYDAANGWFILLNPVASQAYPPNYKDKEFYCTINVTDSDHDIDVAAGSVRDYANTVNMELTAKTKRIDEAWTEGTNAGGFPSGLTLAANQEYNFFAIHKNDGTVDYGWDTSNTAANLLADATDYTEYRLIDKHITDSLKNIHNFIPSGNYRQWTTLEADIDESGTSWLPTSRTNYAVRCPAGLVADISFSFYIDSGSGAFTYCLGLATSPDATDTTPTGTITNLPLKQILQDDGGGHGIAANLRLKTNSSSEIGLKFAYDINHATYAVYLSGFVNGFYIDI